MKENQQETLRDALQKTQEHGRKIMDDLLATLKNNDISYQTNIRETEIIVENQDSTEIKKLIDETLAKESINYMLSNIVISVNELNGVTVIRLKYA